VAREPDSDSLAFVHPEYSIRLADATIAAQTLIRMSEQQSDLTSLEGSLQQSWDFPAARTAVGQCRGSLLVTDFMTSRLEPRSRVELFQRVVRGMLEVADVRAIHWHPSGRVIEPTAYKSAYESGNRGALFAASAINVRMFSNERGLIIMDTLGLGALELPDVQCYYRGLSEDAVAKFLFNLGWYLFSSGNRIADGDTLSGADGRTPWRVRHRRSLLAPSRPVLDIDPGPAYAGHEI
jgi:hypothetical protein